MSASPVGATADIAAMMRAAHVCIDGDPKVFEDRFAAPLSGFSNEESLRTALGHLEAEFTAHYPRDRVRAFLRWTRAGVTLRSRYAEDCLAEAIEQGVSQYVILGAGLDSFAYRRPDLENSLRVFEADHAASQRHKQARLAELGITPPDHLTFVPIDFERDSIMKSLCAHGFRSDQAAFFSWLGVTWFLSEQAIFRTLSEIAKAATGSEIVFEYPIADDLLDQEERGVFGMIKQLGAARGEPVYSAFDPAYMVRRVKELGFSEVQDLTPSEANARYFSDRTDELRMPGLGHLLRARIGENWSKQFKFYDVLDFPVVRIEGSRLPQGYGSQWVAEMDALVKRGDPFSFIFLSSAENPVHEDQKTQTQWLKKNKKMFTALCRGAVSIETDPAKRLLKHAQAFAITTAFGVRFSVAPNRAEAEARARRLLAGDVLSDDDE